ncbi:Uncharacterised protein [Phocaeicola vulgatus]|uniref:Uncharacterized protein n=1 Tax=Phocaeicola vulgatus TaxID=821 RepID=A0A174NCF3_PHOVU|nr:Uncharacterised protein [Phocaeicola vulgatus]
MWRRRKLQNKAKRELTGLRHEGVKKDLYKDACNNFSDYRRRFYMCRSVAGNLTVPIFRKSKAAFEFSLSG